MDLRTISYHPKTGDKLHVGIIPDGGRRWAVNKNISLSESYRISREFIMEIITYLFTEHVDEVSVYLASIQNFRRSEREKEVLCDVINWGLSNKYLALGHQLKCCIKVIGEMSILPDELQETIKKIQEETSGYTNQRINLCIAYNPLNEINKAIKSTKPGEFFINNLGIKKPVNIIIRSGDANVLSNFLPLQSGFARLYFEGKLFNDITLDDIKKYYQDYVKLDLKYGE